MRQFVKPMIVGLVMSAGGLIVLDSAEAEVVEVATVDGETLSGEIASIGDGQISIDGRDPIPIDDAVTISVPATPKRSPATTTVTLRDESIARATRVTGDATTLTIELRRVEPVRVDARSVRGVRFGSPSPESDAAWFAILDNNVRGDRIVIRRDGGALDVAEGVIESFDSNAVAFNLDGDTISAPTARLEGITFGSAADAQTKANITVADAYGCVWKSESISADGEGLSMKIGGVESMVRVPWSIVRSVGFGGSMTPLHTLEPLDRTYRAFGGLRLRDDLTSIVHARRNESTRLTLAAGTRMTYRRPDGASRLVGTVVRSDSVDSATRCQVRIVDGDGEQLWSASLDDDRGQGFDLDVGSVSRVTIEVTGGGDGTLGDRVDLINARFLR